MIKKDSDDSDNSVENVEPLDEDPQDPLTTESENKDINNKEIIAEEEE